MSLFDTHCHLASEDFRDNFLTTLETAAAENVSHITMIATHLEDGRRAKSLEATRSPIKLFSSLGIHPHEAKKFNAEAGTALNNEINDYVAVGETGLDYHYNFSTPEEQKENFAFHIDLAARTGKPLVIHCREAADDIYAMLFAKKNTFVKCPGIMHCFAESEEWAKKFLDLGFYLSISGIVTFKAAENIRVVAKVIPADRLLIETDSPYLAPVPYRGKKNSPAYLRSTFDKLVEVRGDEPGGLETQLLHNSKAVFGV